MSQPCPSNLALDAFRLGLDDRVSAHVKGCPRCEAWLQAQARWEETGVPPLRIPPAPEPRRASRALWKYWLGLGAPAAVGVALLLSTFRHLAIVPDVRRKVQGLTETAKGNAVTVEIARVSRGALSWLSPHDLLRPHDALRFFVHRVDTADAYVLVGSVDGTKRLARFYPDDPQGCSVPLPKAGEALDGSITLDEAAGPERLVVVVSHQPLCWPQVTDVLTRFGMGEPPSELLSWPSVHVARFVFQKDPAADPPGATR